MKIGLQTNQFVDSYDSDTNVFTKMLETDLNIKIEFYQLPKDNTEVQTKVSLMASNPSELPDILMVDGSLTKEAILNYGMNGVFLPLNQYLANPDLTPNWSLIPEDDRQTMLNGMTSADGNIYGLAAYEPEYWNLTPFRMYINKAWLDKLGLEVPTTSEELKNVLTHFVNDDPNGNGLKDEIGVYGCASGTYGVMTNLALMNMFQYYNGKLANNGLEYGPDGTTVIAPFANDAWREGLEYLRDLNKNGLLASSMFTDDMTQFKATLNNAENIVGLVTVGSNGGSWTDCDNNPNYAEMEMIPYPKGPEGVGYTPYQPYEPGQEFFVTSNASDPELCFRIGEYFFNYKVSMDERFGIQGEDWTDKQTDLEKVDNAYTATGLTDQLLLGFDYNGASNKWVTNSSVFWHNVGPRYAPSGYDLGVVDLAKPYDANAVTLSLKANVANAKYNHDNHPDKVLAPLHYTADEGTQTAEIITNIDSYVMSSMAEFVTGQRELNDTTWQEYLSTLDSMGLQTWLSCAQTAADRQANQ